MHLLDWLILASSLIVVLFQGWWFSRKTKNNEDYFVGNRHMPWLAVGLSLFASAFSSLSFVGIPTSAAYGDYHFFLAILFIPFAVVPIVGWVFVPVYQRLRLTSAYEYLERRFNRKVRLAGSLLYSGYTIGWMGSIVYATGIILQAVLELNSGQLTWLLIGLGICTTVYTTAGGYKAVVWTEVMQAILLAGTVITILFLAISRVDGGIAEVMRLGAKHNKFDMFNFRLDVTSQGTFFAACAYGLFGYVAANATSQAAVQRYVSMPNVAAAWRALLIKGFATAGVCLLFFLLGTTLFAFYTQHPPASPGSDGIFPALPKSDQLATHFVSVELPYPGLLGLLLAGLAAAMMSTVSGGLNSLTVLVVCDWLPGRKLGLTASRLLSALFGASTIIVALLAPYLGKDVIEILMKIAGAFFGPLFGLFLLGLMVPRANSAGVLIGLAIGLSVVGVLFLTTNVAAWWYGFFAFIPTFVVGAAASLFFPKTKMDAGLTLYG
ncbi:MAG: sodium/solute symporter [Planctomycetes bacterium]|nr:sodium/solute symporter [Planctomycetota bacterium]